MAMVRKANSNIRRYRVDAEWGYEGIYGDHDDFQGSQNLNFWFTTTGGGNRGYKNRKRHKSF